MPPIGGDEIAPVVETLRDTEYRLAREAERQKEENTKANLAELKRLSDVFVLRARVVNGYDGTLRVIQDRPDKDVHLLKIVIKTPRTDQDLTPAIETYYQPEAKYGDGYLLLATDGTVHDLEGESMNLKDVKLLTISRKTKDGKKFLED